MLGYGGVTCVAAGEIVQDFPATRVFVRRNAVGRAFE